MKRILSLDGGGIRGIISGRLLEALEAATGRPLAHSFDLVAGTSTGGIQACGIVAGVAAADILSLYVRHGAEVFDRNSSGIGDPKYRTEKLDAMLRAVLGARRLSDIHVPELLVPSYCIQFKTPEDTDGDGIPEGAGSVYFKSWKARADASLDAMLWQVARATSAAPIYFPDFGIDGSWYVDGGVFDNNPADSATVAAWKLWPGEELKVLSIGTGSKVTPLNGDRAQNWGVMQWGPEITSVFMDGSADKGAYICRELLGSNFLRCETGLNGVADAFDDVSPLNIANLGELADKFVADNLAKVQAFLV